MGINRGKKRRDKKTKKRREELLRLSSRCESSQCMRRVVQEKREGEGRGVEGGWVSKENEPV